MNSAYLRRKEAARYLGISERTLSDWQRRRLIPFAKPSERVCLFRVTDLDRSIEKMMIGAPGAKS
jgi:excisionase family DNA binding protein